VPERARAASPSSDPAAVQQALTIEWGAIKKKWSDGMTANAAMERARWSLTE